MKLNHANPVNVRLRVGRYTIAPAANIALSMPFAASGIALFHLVPKLRLGTNIVEACFNIEVEAKLPAAMFPGRAWELKDSPN